MPHTPNSTLALILTLACRKARLALTLILLPQLIISQVNKSTEIRIAGSQSLPTLNYKLSNSELEAIDRSIKKIIKKDPLKLRRAEKTVLYGDGISHYDSFVPYLPRLTKTPKDGGQFNQWTFLNGQIRQVETWVDGESYVSEKVWYEDNYPILNIGYNKDGKALSYKYGQYIDGKLARVCFLIANDQPDIPYTVMHIQLFDYSEFDNSYAIYFFNGRDGALRSYRFNAHGVNYTYTPSDGGIRHLSSGRTVDWTEKIYDPWLFNRPTQLRHGLGPVYPNIEESGDEIAERMGQTHLEQLNYKLRNEELIAIWNRIEALKEESPTGNKRSQNVFYGDYPFPPLKLDGQSSASLKKDPLELETYYSYTYADGLLCKVKKITEIPMPMFDYWYDKHGNMVLKILYHSSGNMREVYMGEYENDRLRRVFSFWNAHDLDQNPSLTDIRCYEYFDSGNSRSVYDFDASGKLRHALFDLHGIQLTYVQKRNELIGWDGKLQKALSVRPPSSYQAILNPGQ